jgi:transposase-like protein
MKRTRRNIPPQEKATILKMHLVDKVPVSDLCDKHNIQPTLVYAWQRKLFENAAAVLESKGRVRRDQEAEEEKIARLRQKLSRKNEVLSELMEEHVALKKKLGEI